MGNLADQILDHIRLRGPANAKEIAQALGQERSAVNQALHGSLRAQVRQARDYRWSFTASTHRTGQEASRPVNSRSQLFSYYLDCLSHDDDSGVRVFADSKFEFDYVELKDWPLTSGASDFEGGPIKQLIARQRRDARRKILWLGYPVRVRHARGRKGWEGSFVEPLLIWAQDLEMGELAFLQEPMLNPKALEGMAQSESALEEAARLAEELGLDNADPPELEELSARLRDLRPEWDWKEELAPAPFRAFGELRQIPETGIYNSAVILLADRSPFTVGLERELSDLRTVSGEAIDRSSLGALLGAASGSRATIEGPLLEPVPLNAEQRMAVSEALTAPLTVITGPPGTGKSQVVTAILVNAAWRGLRVLFASKNNKAVDVVTERVNALTSRPILLRLGTRALQEQLAQQITTVLSARLSDADRSAYEQVTANLRQESEVLFNHQRKLNELIELRNSVDTLEREAEEARSVLREEVFASAANIPVVDLEALGAHLRKALRCANPAERSFTERLCWPFLRKSRSQHAIRASDELVKAFTPHSFAVSSGADPMEVLANGEAFLDALRAASAYQDGLGELLSASNLGVIAADVARQTKKLARISAEAWSSWAALLPDRLDTRDRAALGDYAAILRSISRADEEGGTVASQIWRRYYDLGAKTTKALPCWAVTSLAVRGRIPLVPAEFDVLVIDEASQCDIASALPLLYRAKRAVIIGDPQQLRHISRLSEQRDQALMVKHELLDDPGPSWGYRANGLYDLVAARVDSSSIVVLRDHHRSHADIINFSNQFFYGGKLRIATDYRRLNRPDGPAIRWVDVKGHVVRPPTGGAINQVEAAAVVEELRRLAITQRFSGEIGVVTPFRAQANLIEELISRDDGLAPVLASRNFISETAHKFQGDERDVIFFSPVVSRNIAPGALGFLRGQGNLFNVGITRARAALVVVGDAAACSGSEVAYLSAFARYVVGYGGGGTSTVPTVPRVDRPKREYPSVGRPDLVSDWEKVFYAALVDAGLSPLPQYSVDQYILDFALIRPNGRRLNIEIDGERYHSEWDGELVRRDQLRNLRLIEMGWEVIRLWVYQVRDNLPDCVAQVTRWADTADALPAMTAELQPSAAAWLLPSTREPVNGPAPG